MERRQVRVYPQEQSAARLVGVVGFDHEGLGGLSTPWKHDLAAPQEACDTSGT